MVGAAPFSYMCRGQHGHCAAGTTTQIPGRAGTVLHAVEPQFDVHEWPRCDRGDEVIQGFGHARQLTPAEVETSIVAGRVHV